MTQPGLLSNRYLLTGASARITVYQLVAALRSFFCRNSTIAYLVKLACSYWYCLIGVSTRELDGTQGLRRVRVGSGILGLIGSRARQHSLGYSKRQTKKTARRSRIDGPAAFANHLTADEHISLSWRTIILSPMSRTARRTMQQRLMAQQRTSPPQEEVLWSRASQRMRPLLHRYRNRRRLICCRRRIMPLLGQAQ